MQTAEYEIEYTDKDGINLSISFTAEYEHEDIGIGSYEYWGSRATDKHIVCTCSSISIDSATNEDGLDIVGSLDKELLKRIESHCEEHANEHAPEPEDDGDYDEDRPSPYEDESYTD